MVRFGLNLGFVQVVLKAFDLQFQIGFQALFAGVQTSVEGAIASFRKQEASSYR